jgi:hypothetical protein
MGALRPFTVLGVVTITSGTPVNLADAFAADLDPSLWSCYVNTIFIQAHEGNSTADIYVCDRDYVSGDDSKRGAVLSTRQYINLTSGTQSNCLDPRDVVLDGSGGTLKARVMILKV